MEEQQYPFNQTDQPYVAVDMSKTMIGRWHELQNGQGSATEVHVLLAIEDYITPVIMRFTSPQMVERFARVLIERASEVWPEGTASG